MGSEKETSCLAGRCGEIEYQVNGESRYIDKAPLLL